MGAAVGRLGVAVIGLDGAAVGVEVVKKEKIGDQSIPVSYWALMTKDVLPNSRKKAYSEQQALLKGHYVVPGVLEMATGLLVHHVKSGEKLYPDKPCTYTRCKDRLRNGDRMVVGSFGVSGLDVSFDVYEDLVEDKGGLCGLRKF